MFPLRGHTGEVISATFSPDGLRLATCSADRTAKVWDARTGEELLTLKGHMGKVNFGRFSLDAAGLATISEDATVKVWDLRSSKELLTLHAQGSVPRLGMGIEDVAFSPDGQRLATMGVGPLFNEPVQVWDIRSGQRLLTLRGELSGRQEWHLPRMGVGWQRSTTRR